MACNCCDSMPHPSIRLAADNISYTKYKCGLTAPSDDEGGYFTHTVSDPCNGGGSGSGSSSESIYLTATLVETPVACGEGQDAGTGSITSTLTYNRDDVDTCRSVHTCTGTIHHYTNTFNCGDIITGATQQDLTYSSPYTDEMLLEDVETLMGDFPDAFDDTFASAYKHAIGFPVYGIYAGKAQFKISHTPTATCYLKVWIKMVTDYDDGVTPAVTEWSPVYEWVGTGSPCLANPDVRYDDDSNRIISSDVFTIPIPDDYGHKSVADWKYSCVEGYEPPNDGSANGYPA